MSYAIECPRCGRRGWAEMAADGVAGTYREPTLRMGARRIGCDGCGFFREVPPGQGGDYRLWYRASHRGHTLWARSDGHLEFLIAWLSGDMNQSRLAWVDRVFVECLPKWMLVDRAAVVAKLRQMQRRG